MSLFGVIDLFLVALEPAESSSSTSDPCIPFLSITDDDDDFGSDEVSAKDCFGFLLEL